MFDIRNLITFVGVVIALFLIPGPAVLLTLASSISSGRKVGIATGAGIATGDLLHTTMAVLGLSTLLMTSALAFTVVKDVGAAYLVYLGIRAFFAKTETLDLPTVQQASPRTAFQQGLLTEVLNPKTALFFLAFLPQFVRPAQGLAFLQFMVLGLIFVTLSIAYTSLLALGAGSVGAWLAHHPRANRWQGKFVGSIYLGLGIRLALQER
ncbi:MAG: LysE family translocator [Caldilineaceae bacterium]